MTATKIIVIGILVALVLPHLLLSWARRDRRRRELEAAEARAVYQAEHMARPRVVSR